MQADASGNSMPLSDPGVVLAHASFLPQLQARDYPGIMRELVAQSVATLGIADETGVREAVLRREAQGATGTSEGVAFPHGKHPDVDGVHCTVALVPNGVLFGTHRDAHLCRIIVLTLSSAYVCDEHLHILAFLAKRLRQAPVRDAVLACHTRQAFLQAIGLSPCP